MPCQGFARVRPRKSAHVCKKLAREPDLLSGDSRRPAPGRAQPRTVEGRGPSNNGRPSPPKPSPGALSGTGARQPGALVCSSVGYLAGSHHRAGAITGPTSLPTVDPHAMWGGHTQARTRSAEFSRILRSAARSVSRRTSTEPCSGVAGDRSPPAAVADQRVSPRRRSDTSPSRPSRGSATGAPPRLA